MSERTAKIVIHSSHTPKPCAISLSILIFVLYDWQEKVTTLRWKLEVVKYDSGGMISIVFLLSYVCFLFAFVYSSKAIQRITIGTHNLPSEPR